LALNPPGTTPTIAIGSESVAATAVQNGPLCAGADQRGAPRPGSPCAAGAFEPNPRTPSTDNPVVPGGPPPRERGGGDLCGAMTTRPTC
jgi:hypothetical protein